MKIKSGLTSLMYFNTTCNKLYINDINILLGIKKNCLIEDDPVVLYFVKITSFIYVLFNYKLDFI